jgi:hypothetical protein
VVEGELLQCLVPGTQFVELVLEGPLLVAAGADDDGRIVDPVDGGAVVVNAVGVV